MQVLKKDIDCSKSLKLDCINLAIDYFIDKCHLYLVYQKIEGITLSSYLKPKCNKKISETEAKSYITKLQDVLKICHEHKLYHDNLNDFNILIKDCKNISVDYNKIILDT